MILRITGAVIVFLLFCSCRWQDTYKGGKKRDAAVSAYFTLLFPIRFTPEKLTKVTI